MRDKAAKSFSLEYCLLLTTSYSCVLNLFYQNVKIPLQTQMIMIIIWVFSKVSESEKGKKDVIK